MPWPAGNGGGLSGLAARLTGVEVAIGIETAAFIALIAGSGGLTAAVVRGRPRVQRGNRGCSVVTARDGERQREIGGREREKQREAG